MTTWIAILYFAVAPHTAQTINDGHGKARTFASEQQCSQAVKAFSRAVVVERGYCLRSADVKAIAGRLP